MFIKWKQMFSIPTLARLASGATLAASFPSMAQQIWAPSARGFLLAMLNSSFAFYLFAFQVHEKSVLLPVLPATLMVLEEPQLVRYLIPYAVISMFPLLRRDGLILPYFTLLALFFLLPKCPTQWSPDNVPESQNKLMTVINMNMVEIFSLVGAVTLHIIYLFVSPPPRYPFLFEALITTYAFAHFVGLAAYTNWRQWTVPGDERQVSADKKRL